MCACIHDYNFEEKLPQYFIVEMAMPMPQVRLDYAIMASLNTIVKINGLYL